MSRRMEVNVEFKFFINRELSELVYFFRKYMEKFGTKRGVGYTNKERNQ